MLHKSEIRQQNGLHALHDGRFELCLPRPRGLREVFTGETYAPGTRVTLNLKKGQTRLFEYLG